MKNVQEVKFPMYAVVNTGTNFVYDVALNRRDAGFEPAQSITIQNKEALIALKKVVEEALKYDI